MTITIEKYVFQNTETDDLISPELVTISNGNGLSVEMSTFGATILSVQFQSNEMSVLNMPDKRAPLPSNTYAGAVCGRVAGRIAKSTFQLDNETYHLKPTNEHFTLHGGHGGFHNRLWTIHSIIDNETMIGVEMVYLSKDDEEGFPGDLHNLVRYAIMKRSNEFIIVFKAKLIGASKPSTIVNLVNHVYWNLSGVPAEHIRNHKLRLFCSAYLPIDINGIPRNVIAPVEDTPFDLTGATGDFIDVDAVGQEHGDNHGFDHCFVVDEADQPLQRDLGDGAIKLNPVAILEHPTSNRALHIFTTQPACQVYTANYFQGDSKHTAIALETQKFPDAINQSTFPSVILRKGDSYHESTLYQFSSIS